MGNNQGGFHKHSAMSQSINDDDMPPTQIDLGQSFDQILAGLDTIDMQEYDDDHDGITDQTAPISDDDDDDDDVKKIDTNDTMPSTFVSKQPSELEQQLGSVSPNLTIQSGNTLYAVPSLQFSHSNSISKSIKAYEFSDDSNILDDITEIFQYVKQLGHGASSRVLLAKHIENGKLYALKELNKSDKKAAKAFARESALFAHLGNENANIVTYFDSFMDSHCYYVATEYCSGGTMLDRIISMNQFTEKKAAEFIKILIGAIQYMHSKNVVHRDLKLNNMVFNEKGDNATLKIIDFGDSDIIEEDLYYRDVVGTTYYMAPELFNRKKRSGKTWKKSDMWSLGVVTYILCTGLVPFAGKAYESIVKKIRKGKYSIPGHIVLSEFCKDFISKLLVLDPKQRMSPEESMEHPWIQGKAEENVMAPNIMQNLSSFKSAHKMQAILVNALIPELQVDEVTFLMAQLKKIMNAKGAKDKNGKSSTIMHQKEVMKYLISHSDIASLQPKLANFNAQKIFEFTEGIQEMQRVKSKSAHLKDQSLDLDELDSIFEEMMVLNDDQNIHKLPMLEELVENEDGDDDGDDAKDNKDNNKTSGYGLNDTITVAQFRAIMEKSDKVYNVNEIIKDLDPENTGRIDIAMVLMYDNHVNLATIDVQ